MGPCFLKHNYASKILYLHIKQNLPVQTPSSVRAKRNVPSTRLTTGKAEAIVEELGADLFLVVII